MFNVTRSEENPILVPIRRSAWESEAVFNGCPVKQGGKVHMVYRALSEPQSIYGNNLNLSTVGHAVSKDGIHFENRQRLIYPEHDWEKYGCEDPRITYLNGKYYIFYTALSQFPFCADGIKVAVATTKDFSSIEEKHPVTPFNAKAMALFPSLFHDHYVALLTVNTDNPPARICWASFKREEDMWSPNYWREWYKRLDYFTLPLQRRGGDQVELGSPPIRTPQGWLIIYSYITDYLANRPQFTIEAALLDLEDPRKVLGRSKHPILVPEEEYEIYGKVPNIVFPSGALIEKNMLRLYYGGADTVCCMAELSLSGLTKDILSPPKPPPHFLRNLNNPVLEPIADHAWEANAVFNPGAWWDGEKVHLVYRAMSHDNTSVFGYASSKNGLDIDTRLPEPIYVPREGFEAKLTPNGNSGVEDARLTQIGETIYMLYTAFDGKNPPRIAMSSIKKEDFQAHNWNWTTPMLISPPGVDDKDGAIFPEKINNKYAIIHRINNGVDINFMDDLKFEKKRWLTEEKLFYPRKGSWEGEKIGLASTPHKLKDGWLLFYHGVSDEGRKYSLGAVMLDLKNPKLILGRTDQPIFEPQEQYEKHGIVPNVVFPCGSAIINDMIFIYYGGADKVIGTAFLELKKLLGYLE